MFIHDYAVKRTVQRLTIAVLLAVLGISTAYAIDNPDAPDYLGQFHAQVQQHEATIQKQSSNNAEARGNYLRFLDEQLNRAYQRLMEKLPSEQQAQLRQSQREWLRYRDTESAFIDGNWTPEQFGSSSSVSRIDYRAAIVRARIEQLLGYLKNY